MSSGNGPPSTDPREQFQRVDALFDAALDVDSSARVQFVNAATEGDLELRTAVMRLLLAHERSGTFLDTPAVPDAVLVRLQTAMGAGYKVLRRIAAGGMATVYVAHDLRHERSVAVKVFTTGSDNRVEAELDAERFLSEIRVMARLQHPHVLPLFDSGAEGGLLFFVMPFVAGETLRERLSNEAPLPVAEALRIAHAVAGAVSYAHSEGVVHRDLKPANILLRDGHPLVADFGIALAVSTRDDQRVTRSGMLVGTAHYMSPEQAAGERAIDERTDVYSLGAVLYEMLVGDPPHVASTTQGVLAKVRAERPTSPHLLRETVPMWLSLVIDRALAKRPGDRFQSMRDFEQALHPPSGSAGERTAPTRHPWRTYAAAAAAAGALVAFTVVHKLRDTAVPPAASRFVVAPLRDAAIGRAPTITPDGESLVYAGSAEKGRRLFVRNVNELSARALQGTEGALNTFVSPDGQWIGFTTSDDKLRKVSLKGGAPSVLAGVFRYSAAAWAGNATIVVDSYGEQGLAWVSASGGTLHSLTRLDTLRRDSGHWNPFVLPDARTVVFTIARSRSGPGPQVGELALVTLDTTASMPGSVTPLGVQARQAIGYVDGWLVYIGADGGGLMAVQLNAETRRLRGTPRRVLEQPDGGLGVAALATNGTLLYTRTQTANAPVIVDSLGTAKPLLAGVGGSFMNPRLSPDGRRVALQATTAQGNDIWIYDVATSTPSRITSSGSAVGPTFTPDGRYVVYFSTQDARDALWRAAVDGSTAPQRIVAAAGVFGASVSSDGRHVMFQRIMNGTWSVWQADLLGDRVPRPVVREAYDAFMPSLAPDGRSLAYAANASGRYEIYVRPFPGPGAPVQVSQDGGTEPVWSSDGRRLYYRGDRRMQSATILQGAGVSVTDRRVLFTEAFDGDMPMPHRNYDVTRDGKHFVMIAAQPDATPQTIVVLNWLQELRARLREATPGQ